jgi:hypothetical protein
VKKRLIFLFLLILCSPFLMAEFIYRYQIFSIGEMPSPPQNATLPPMVAQAIWVSFGEKMPLEIQPFYSWDYLKLFFPPREINSSGLALTTFLARCHLQQLGKRDRNLTYRLKTIALCMWISRHWEADQAIFAAKNYLWIVGFPNLSKDGKVEGLDNISRIKFGKSIKSLKPDELAEILAMTRTNDPKVIAIIRNSILEKMLNNGAITQSQFDEYVSNESLKKIPRSVK